MHAGREWEDSSTVAAAQPCWVRKVWGCSPCVLNAQWPGKTSGLGMCVLLALKPCDQEGRVLGFDAQRREIPSSSNQGYDSELYHAFKFPSTFQRTAHCPRVIMELSASVSYTN